MVLVSINVGLPKDVAWNGGSVRTSIWKEPVQGRVMARRLNLDGDRQSDLKGHGGEQRAILVYQLSSYRFWNELLGLPLEAFGQFGENFTVDGLDDADVCIGDRFRIGEALFEVSQPRVTCYRLGLRLQQPRLPALLVEHGRPGFYMRVLEEGYVQAGDAVVKVAADPRQMSVAQTDALLYMPAHPVETLERVLGVPALSPGWRRSFQALLKAAVAGPIDGNPGLRPASEGPLAWPGFQPLRVVATQEETQDVRSFVMASTGAAPLAPYQAGQHLAVRVIVEKAPVTRMYSLSGDPAAGTYRIGVKREAGGVASGHLVQDVRVGDTIETSAPRGNFALLDGEGPVVLLSAGIGVTPLLCMLHALANSGTARTVFWLHGARDGRHHAFKTEAARLLRMLPGARGHVVYSEPGADDLVGQTFDESGHIDAAMLVRLGVSPKSDFYLCGPPGFLASLPSQLKEVMGVERWRVHLEVFGPVRTGGAAGIPRPHAPSGPPGQGPRVTFARSGLVVHWSDPRQTLLELTEACDVAAQWSCRSGVCQTCETPMLSGAVTYSPEPIARPGRGTVLLCCARPVGDIELDL